MAVGDLNGDGELDVAQVSFPEETVSVVFGLGFGAFSAPVQLLSSPSGYLPWDLGIADVNHDGRNDIVTVHRNFNTVTILYGTGAGAFQQYVNTGQTDAGPFALDLGNINGDGDIDLVVGNRSAGTMTFHAGTPDGRFADKLSFGECSTCTDVDVEDIDHDGIEDIAVAKQGGIRLYRGVQAGTPEFVLQLTLANPDRCLISDVDANGWMDVVVIRGPTDDDVSVFRATGPFTFLPGTEFPVGQGASAVAVEDMDQDGKRDIVTANEDVFVGTITILKGSGLGHFGGRMDYPASPSASEIAIADITLDGRPDVLTGGGRALGVMPNRGDGDFGPDRGFFAVRSLQQIALVDFNQDGIQDVVYGGPSSPGTLGVRLGDGNGKFIEYLHFNPTDSAARLSSGDLNGDGFPDIVTSNISINGIAIWLNQQGVSLGQPMLTAAAGVARCIAIGDVSRDGIPDLVMAMGSASKLVVMRGLGDGSFTLNGSYPTGPSTEACRLADLDRDGDLDVVAACRNFPTTVTTYFNSGSGLMVGRQDYPTGTGCEDVQVADFNGDGMPDIAVGTGLSQFGVLRGHGAAGFDAMQTFLTEPSSHVLLAGDYNHDNRIDIAVASLNINSVTVHYGNGYGQFSRGPGHGVGDNPEEMASADLNGDNRLDLVVAANGSGTITSLVNIAPGSTTGVADMLDSPSFFMAYAAPNPFLAHTSVAVDIPADDRFSITILDTRGGLVRSLFEGYLPRGISRFTWDGTTASGRSAPGGTYFVLAANGATRQVRRITFLGGR